MDARASDDTPKLAGLAPPPRRTPGFGLIRPDDAQNPMPGIIAAAYEQPVTFQPGVLGGLYVVADPEGVKRVFLDNVANYPKAPIERRFFSAAFGDGLLSSEGDTWRAHRRIMSPPFSPTVVAGYAPAMVEETLAFAETWAAAPADAPRDVAADMTDLTLRIISRTVFATDGAALGQMMAHAVSGAMAALRPSLLDFLPGLQGVMARRRDRRMAKVFAEFDAVVARLIAEREAAPGGTDLLSRLIAARDAETGAAMTAKEVRDQVVTIFVAGHETTAVAMSWIWYLLDRHPAVFERLAAELDAVLAGRTPTREDLAALPYLRMVVDEAMRFYPPAPGTSARQAQADDEICGVKIPKGAMVFVSPWVTHHHRLYWDRPDRFEPERFARDAAAGRPRFAYLPFGAGPRICIGAALALSEMHIVLAILAQRFRPRLVPGHEVAIRHQITMRPRDGLPMFVTRR